MIHFVEINGLIFSFHRIRQRRDTKDTTTSESANMEDDLVEFRPGAPDKSGLTRSNSFSDAPGTPSVGNLLRG